MKQVVTGSEIKEIEQYAIREIGISSLVLMERAALSVTRHIKEQFTDNQKICIVCGSGNNGADGVAVARQLLEASYNVTVVVLGKKEKFSEEMKVQLSILDKMNIYYVEKIPQEDFVCYVDAIFGVGLTRDITDESILNAIDTINSSDAYIYSVDIPTGISTDNGQIMGKAIRANETITFSYKKVGMCLYPGKEYSGKVCLEEIGIVPICEKNTKVAHYTYEEQDGAKLPKRNPNGNKGTFGKVAVIAGNNEISGACILCAEAVLRNGAGMVRVLSSENNLEVIRKALPEAMVQALEESDTMEQTIMSAINWADCIVIGPGIGTDKTAYLKMLYTLNAFPKGKRLVIDADGINLIGKYEDLKKLTCNVKNLVYTPHMMELSRLTGYSMEELKNDLDNAMTEALEIEDAIYVCKDSVTRVYSKDKPIFINSFGNSGMATAGSGDVLAGIIAANLSRKEMDVYEGTILGVHLHSLAGDWAAKEWGQNSLLAGDIIKAMSQVLKKMEEFF